MKKTILLLFAVLFTLSLVQAAAYIKFDGIDGESTEESHIRWSDILSFSQSIHQPSTGEGATRRRGDVVLEDIVVVKELDKASPKLAESLLKEKVFPKVRIDVTAFYSDEQKVYYTYELKNVMVTSYSISGSGQAEEVPVEQLTLNFEEIKVEYTQYGIAGEILDIVSYLWKIIKRAF